MPIYVYDCPICEKTVEQRRTISEMDTPKPCPVEGCEGVLKKRITVLGNVISYNVPSS